MPVRDFPDAKAARPVLDGAETGVGISAEAEVRIGVGIEAESATGKLSENAAPDTVALGNAAQARPAALPPAQDAAAPPAPAKRPLRDMILRRLRPGWVRRAMDAALAPYERFAPLRVIGLPPGQRLAVIAPHPDDESIGAGGLMALWHAAGRETHVWLLTAGEAGSPALRQMPQGPGRAALMAEVTQTRAREFAAALGVLGATGSGLDGADGALWQAEEHLAETIAQSWRNAPPDVIAAPDPGDRHIDHAAAARITARAANLAGLPADTPVLGYEVWSPCPANVVLPLDGAAVAKRRAIAAHASQTASTDYVAAAGALNLYRGVTAGLGPVPAEAFHRQSLRAYAAHAARLKV